ncbi:periostin isoform X1 [Ictalurus punctatus]|uniref:Periostin isoform X1 n=1 Tax=Ictalurus punctatus TaxID=7998 RepID=A0A2D0SRK5_ICTPU|nr:periostin isoform X1 [Ictalurus punctatus]
MALMCGAKVRMKFVFVTTFVLLALFYLDQVDSSAYDKIVSHSRIRAKNQGPNVCALQQVIGTKKKYFSTCRNWYQKTICGKKAIVLYECCPGYMKLEGMRGCPAAVPIDNIYITLGLLKLDITQQYSDLSKIREEIDGAGSYTMFAPSNDAWEQLDVTARNALVNNAKTELYNTLRYHIVNKRFLTKDLKNDMTLQSMYNKQGLHINHYSNGIVTVNCARIIHANQVSTNGAVHIIDRVISAVGNSIRDVIQSNEELSLLHKTANVESSLLERLGKPGHYTLFAPTNKALEQLDNAVLERILKDKTLLQAFLKYHLLSSVQCSETIMAGTAYETLEGSVIEIGCNGDSLTINGMKMVLKKDIITSNGVIHLIDQVLMPDSAKQVIELVGDSQRMFGDMVSEMGLSAAMTPETEYTLLAPLNGVFTNEIMALDQHLLKIILENHILKLKVTLNDFYNGQLLETLGGKLVRVFVYRTAVCIENACMIRGSKEGSNGALHLMRSLIRLPEKTMFELLKADGRFTILLKLMEEAELTEMLKQEGSYTIFAPTDEAFKEMSEDDMKLLTSDLNILRTILLYHFSSGIVINGGLEGGVTNLLKTIQGNNLQVHSVNNSINVNSVNVKDNDLMASNGVVHVVKSLLYPADLPVGHEDLLYLLRKLIKYTQIKFVNGYTYREIPLTFIKRFITTHVIETGPEIKVIETKPIIKKVTQVTETGPKVDKVVVGGDHVITEFKLTKLIETKPVVKEVVIEGEPKFTTVRRVIEGDPSVTTVTRLIGTGGELDAEVEIKKILSEDLSKVKKVLESELHNQEEKITKLIEGGGGEITTVTKVIRPDPHIIEGPDFSRITSFKHSPELIEEESERITKIIKHGGSQKRAAVQRPPAGMKRRVRPARHPFKPRQ